MNFKMSQRIIQINGLIKKELSRVLLKGEGFDRHTLITITRVETTKDLAQAKAYISVLPSEKFPEIMDFLKKNIYYIQRELNRKISTKRVPKIVFYKECKTEEADKIERLIEKIHKHND